MIAPYIPCADPLLRNVPLTAPFDVAPEVEKLNALLLTRVSGDAEELRAQGAPGGVPTLMDSEATRPNSTVIATVRPLPAWPRHAPSNGEGDPV